MNHADAQGKGILGRAYDHFLAVNKDLTFIGEIDTGEHVHERGFAASVFAQKSKNFTAVNIQTYIMVCIDVTKVFSDMPHADSGDLLFQSTASSGGDLLQKRENTAKGSTVYTALPLAVWSLQGLHKVNLRRPGEKYHRCQDRSKVQSDTQTRGNTRRR